MAKGPANGTPALYSEPMNVDPPECPYGYPDTQLREMLSLREYTLLAVYMRGQTMMLCEGRRYNHEKGRYEPDACAEHPHGVVIYAHDFDRWRAGLPIVD